MRNAPAGLFTALVAAGVTSAAIAHARPVAHYNWNDCGPFVRDQTGAGPLVYAQTFSITGLTPGTQRVTFFVTINLAPWTQAWEFQSGGCAGPGRLTASPEAAGCDAIPALAMTKVWMSLPDDAAAANLIVSCDLDPSFVPDPARRYGFATVRFDHALSGTVCGGEYAPMCFLLDATVLEGISGIAVADVEHDRLTWNDPSDEPNCAPRLTGLPAARTSWGRVKTVCRQSATTPARKTRA